MSVAAGSPSGPLFVVSGSWVLKQKSKGVTFKYSFSDRPTAALNVSAARALHQSVDGASVRAWPHRCTVSMQSGQWRR